MDKELLSFAIETLLTKQQPQVYSTQAGDVITPQPFDRKLDDATLVEMRDLITERVTSNAGAIADALVEQIRHHNQMPSSNVMFELCDEVMTVFGPVSTNQVTAIDPKLSGALLSIFLACNYPYREPSMFLSRFLSPARNPSREEMTHNFNRLCEYVTGMRVGIEKLTHVMLAPEAYSPFAILRNCDSKVVILHDCSDKDKLRAIADEKGMVVLTATAENGSTRPELMLLLMLNVYNATDIDNGYIFLKYERDSWRWTGNLGYIAVEYYINNTDGIRDELERKAPGFLKEFDEELEIIHEEMNQEPEE